MGKAGGLRSFWNEKALAAGVYLGLMPCCSGRQGTHAYTLGKNAKVKGLACIYRGAAVLYVSTQGAKHQVRIYSGCLLLFFG